MNCEQSWELMCTWTESDSLRKHMLAVEAAMRAHARRFGEDEEKWGITGLLHDMDYEKHPTPDEHPMVGVRELESRGYPEDVIHAIKGHADYLDVPSRHPHVQNALRRGRALRLYRGLRPHASRRSRKHEGKERPQEDEAEVLRRGQTGTTA